MKAEAAKYEAETQKQMQGLQQRMPDMTMTLEPGAGVVDGEMITAAGYFLLNFHCGYFILII